MNLYINQDLRNWHSSMVREASLRSKKYTEYIAISGRLKGFTAEKDSAPSLLMSALEIMELFNRFFSSQWRWFSILVAAIKTGFQQDLNRDALA